MNEFYEKCYSRDDHLVGKIPAYELHPFYKGCILDLSTVDLAVHLVMTDSLTVFLPKDISSEQKSDKLDRLRKWVKTVAFMTSNNSQDHIPTFPP